MIATIIALSSHAAVADGYYMRGGYGGYGAYGYSAHGYGGYGYRRAFALPYAVGPAYGYAAPYCDCPPPYAYAPGPRYFHGYGPSGFYGGRYGYGRYVPGTIYNRNQS
jgi:hypothetical protein